MFAPLDTTLPKLSKAVMAIKSALPAIADAEPVIEKLTAAAGLTVKLRPWAALELIEPSLTLTVIPSALYKTIEPPAEETPEVKVMVVLEPKLTAILFLSVTVGIKLPMDEAPENTNDLSPV